MAITVRGFNFSPTFEFSAEVVISDWITIILKKGYQLYYSCISIHSQMIKCWGCLEVNGEWRKEHISSPTRLSRKNLEYRWIGSMDGTSVFRQSESHRKNYSKIKINFFQALLQPDAPNLFCQLVAQVLLIIVLITAEFSCLHKRGQNNYCK